MENLSGWLKADGGEALLERANELGRVVVRRAYGDFSIASVSVRQTELNLLGFEFVHVYHPVKGKNSADIQIVVDVMEYLARIPDLEWVVLATGDSDFSPLFRRLRELGKSVVGVGPRSALSEAVKKSCNRFIYIDEESTTDGLSTSLKTTQLLEDALDLLERVLDKFPDGVRERFPEGFTRSEEFKYLIEAFGHNRTRGDLRSAIYLLYKAGYVIQQPQKKNDEHILTTHLPESDLIMSKKVDALLVNRLNHLCKLHNTSFVFELVNQLLGTPKNKIVPAI